MRRRIAGALARAALVVGAPGAGARGRAGRGVGLWGGPSSASASALASASAYAAATPGWTVRAGQASLWTCAARRAAAGEAEGEAEAEVEAEGRTLLSLGGLPSTSGLKNASLWPEAGAEPEPETPPEEEDGVAAAAAAAAAEVVQEAGTPQGVTMSAEEVAEAEAAAAAEAEVRAAAVLDAVADMLGGRIGGTWTETLDVGEDGRRARMVFEAEKEASEEAEALAGTVLPEGDKHRFVGEWWSMFREEPPEEGQSEAEGEAQIAFAEAVEAFSHELNALARLDELNQIDTPELRQRVDRINALKEAGMPYDPLAGDYGPGKWGPGPTWIPDVEGLLEAAKVPQPMGLSSGRPRSDEDTKFLEAEFRRLVLAYKKKEEELAERARAGRERPGVHAAAAAEAGKEGETEEERAAREEAAERKEKLAAFAEQWPVWSGVGERPRPWEAEGKAVPLSEMPPRLIREVEDDFERRVRYGCHRRLFGNETDAEVYEAVMNQEAAEVVVAASRKLQWQEGLGPSGMATMQEVDDMPQWWEWEEDFARRNEIALMGDPFDDVLPGDDPAKSADDLRVEGMDKVVADAAGRMDREVQEAARDWPFIRYIQIRKFVDYDTKRLKEEAKALGAPQEEIDNIKSDAEGIAEGLELDKPQLGWMELQQIADEYNASGIGELPVMIDHVLPPDEVDLAERLDAYFEGDITAPSSMDGAEISKYYLEQWLGSTAFRIEEELAACAMVMENTSLYFVGIDGSLDAHVGTPFLAMQKRRMRYAAQMLHMADIFTFARRLHEPAAGDAGGVAEDDFPLEGASILRQATGGGLGRPASEFGSGQARAQAFKDGSRFMASVALRLTLQKTLTAQADTFVLEMRRKVARAGSLSDGKVSLSQIDTEHATSGATLMGDIGSTLLNAALIRQGSATVGTLQRGPFERPGAKPGDGSPPWEVSLRELDAEFEEALGEAILRCLLESCIVEVDPINDESEDKNMTAELDMLMEELKKETKADELEQGRMGEVDERAESNVAKPTSKLEGVLQRGERARLHELEKPEDEVKWASGDDLALPNSSDIMRESEGVEEGLEEVEGWAEDIEEVKGEVKDLENVKFIGYDEELSPEDEKYEKSVTEEMILKEFEPVWVRKDKLKNLYMNEVGGDWAKAWEELEAYEEEDKAEESEELIFDGPEEETVEETVEDLDFESAERDKRVKAILAEQRDEDVPKGWPSHWPRDLTTAAQSGTLDAGLLPMFASQPGMIEEEADNPFALKPSLRPKVDWASPGEEKVPGVRWTGDAAQAMPWAAMDDEDVIIEDSEGSRAKQEDPEAVRGFPRIYSPLLERYVWHDPVRGVDVDENNDPIFADVEYELFDWRKDDTLVHYDARSEVHRKKMAMQILQQSNAPDASGAPFPFDDEVDVAEERKKEDWEAAAREEAAMEETARRKREDTDLLAEDELGDEDEDTLQESNAFASNGVQVVATKRGRRNVMEDRIIEHRKLLLQQRDILLAAREERGLGSAPGAGIFWTQQSPEAATVKVPFDLKLNRDSPLLTGAVPELDPEPKWPPEGWEFAFSFFYERIKYGRQESRPLATSHWRSGEADKGKYGEKFQVRMLSFVAAHPKVVELATAAKVSKADKMISVYAGEAYGADKDDGDDDDDEGGLDGMMGNHLLPMRVPPLPWTGFWSGGYFTHPMPLIRNIDHSPSTVAEVDRYMFLDPEGSNRSKEVIEALNRVNMVQWQINVPIYRLQRLLAAEARDAESTFVKHIEYDQSPSEEDFGLRMRSSHWESPPDDLSPVHAPMGANTEVFVAKGPPREAKYIEGTLEAIDPTWSKEQTEAAIKRYKKEVASTRRLRAQPGKELFSMRKIGGKGKDRAKLLTDIMRQDEIVEIVESLLEWGEGIQPFYVPHSIDFRGRVYPVTTALNQMGDDPIKALLLFGEARALGQFGFNWLLMHAANCHAGGGIDKESFHDRAEFIRENWENVVESAKTPLKHGLKAWWRQGEAPWMLLAACRELVAAQRHFDQWGTYETYPCALPVGVDGSCNGLQHYAALGRDEEGALDVNLTSRGRPGDVYTRVATKVQALMRADLYKSFPEDAFSRAYDRLMQNDEAWDRVEEDRFQLEASKIRYNRAMAKMMITEIDRKLVKQTVMTTVYGVTFSGAKEQVRKRLEERGWGTGPNVEAMRREASVYVAKKIDEAQMNEFGSSKRLMTWLTECAKIITTGANDLGELDREIGQINKWRKSRGERPTADPARPFRGTRLPGLEIQWTSPIGLVVRQPYEKAVKEDDDMFEFFESDDHTEGTMDVDAYRQILGFPPNYIHSLDASHLMQTVLKCTDRGIAFAGVHDSFWTHAGTATELGVIARQEFRSMHKRDLMAELKEELERTYYPLKMPKLPDRGTLDINSVLEAAYFFA